MLIISVCIKTSLLSHFEDDQDDMVQRYPLKDQILIEKWPDSICDYIEGAFRLVISLYYSTVCQNIMSGSTISSSTSMRTYLEQGTICV